MASLWTRLFGWGNGASVEITGLQSRPELNGTHGTVLGSERGRYQVQLDDHTKVLVQDKNLVAWRDKEVSEDTVLLELPLPLVHGVPRDATVAAVGKGKRVDQDKLGAEVDLAVKQACTAALSSGLRTWRTPHLRKAVDELLDAYPHRGGSSKHFSDTILVECAEKTLPSPARSWVYSFIIFARPRMVVTPSRALFTPLCTSPFSCSPTVVYREGTFVQVREGPPSLYYLSPELWTTAQMDKEALMKCPCSRCAEPDLLRPLPCPQCGTACHPERGDAHWHCKTCCGSVSPEGKGYVEEWLTAMVLDHVRRPTRYSQTHAIALLRLCSKLLHRDHWTTACMAALLINYVCSGTVGAAKLGETGEGTLRDIATFLNYWKERTGWDEAVRPYGLTALMEGDRESKLEKFIGGVPTASDGESLEKRMWGGGLGVEEMHVRTAEGKLREALIGKTDPLSDPFSSQQEQIGYVDNLLSQMGFDPDENGEYPSGAYMSLLSKINHGDAYEERMEEMKRQQREARKQREAGQH